MVPCTTLSRTLVIVLTSDADSHIPDEQLEQEFKRMLTHNPGIMNEWTVEKVTILPTQ